jgi:hypothetical protein
VLQMAVIAEFQGSRLATLGSSTCLTRPSRKVDGEVIEPPDRGSRFASFNFV